VAGFETFGSGRFSTFGDTYEQYDCDHAFCNAHLLRELIFLWEEQGQAWANTMIDQLRAIQTAVETARHARFAALPDADLDRFHEGYLRIVDAGYAQNPVTAPAPGPTRTEQSPEPARPLPRSPRRHPRLPARLRNPVHQQPVGT